MPLGIAGTGAERTRVDADLLCWSSARAVAMMLLGCYG
jgi:hypothetical protein